MTWSINLLFLMFIQQIFCASGTDPRIVGGKKCEYDLYPYAVAVFSSSVCGGSLISLKWILTAAHCINLTLIEKRKLILRTGFDRTIFVQKRLAIKGIKHYKFKNELHKDVRYDIGLLLVNRPFFNQSAHLAPAKLAYLGFASKCETVTVTGFGEEKNLKSSNKPTKKVKANEPLQCIKFPIITQSKCSQLWNRYVIDESIICTMDEKGEKDTCFGDSGGPIICGGLVIGVTATGGCGEKKLPALHTRVEYFLDFIANVTNIELTAERTVNGSNKIVLSGVILIIAVFLRHLIINGFG